jgi:hypothetical protein
VTLGSDWELPADGGWEGASGHNWNRVV